MILPRALIESKTKMTTEKYVLGYGYDVSITELVSFENEPTDALWGERFFHIRDPDGYQLSFATPVSRKSN